MSAWAARALRQIGLPWLRRPDSQLDHGHLPFGAWEAELTAYARLRTGAPLKVAFGHVGELTWSDEIFLHRAPAGTAPAEALRLAELELEHQLMHFRHGAREVCLLWHCWAYPAEQMVLPWPPWDQVPLPASLVRTALERAWGALALGELAAIERDRVRHAARWIGAAWADGAHRAIEVADRPGMAERLPLPPVPPKSRTWDLILLALAAACDPPGGLPRGVAEALAALRACAVEDIGGYVRASVDLAQALGRANALPHVPELHPAWLRPVWGRWRRERDLRAQLDALARSPETAEMVALTSRGRALAARASGGAAGRFAIGTGGPGKAGAGRRTGDRDDQTPGYETEAPLPDAWGVTPPPALPEQGQPNVNVSLAAGATAEGSGDGQTAGGTTGAGPGTLGALHVVRPTGEDRAAYWQLRGALAPQIERLIERLEAKGNLLDRASPKRFQRSGRIDRGRLHAALSGRETVFSRHVRKPDPEHALCLLLDCSASMTTYAELLREMAILCEAAAAAVGARVTAFSFGPSWERMEPPAHGAPLVSLGRELRPHGGTPFGPALQAAAAWLAQQPYEQKRLWVFSDGRWSARDRTATGWRPEQLTNTVVWVLSGDAPEPPHPAMHIEPAGSLGEFVDAAPRLFWQPPGGRLDLALGGAGEKDVHR